MTETIKIVIVDDHPLVRAGLRAVLEGHAGIEVVAEASDGADVVELARLTSPDVVLMDLSMPRTDGTHSFPTNDIGQFFACRDRLWGPFSIHTIFKNSKVIRKT